MPDAEHLYDAYWSVAGESLNPGLSTGLRELLAANVRPSDDCLDLGCGDGRTCGPWLTENARSYVGVDISAEAVALARERGLDARKIDDAGGLPFAEDSFDAVICTEVLEHLFQPQAAVAEAYRVVRPGGLILVTVPYAAYIRRRFELALRGVFDPYGDACSVSEPWRDPHIRFFTAEPLARLLGSGGFEGVTVSGHSEKPLASFVPPRLHRYLMTRAPSVVCASSRRGRAAASALAQPYRRHAHPARAVCLRRHRFF